MSEHDKPSRGTQTILSNISGLFVGFGKARALAVIDAGCGCRDLAEPLRVEGFTYIGCDIEPEAVIRLERSGFETELLDPTSVRGWLRQSNDDWTAGRWQLYL